MKSISKCVKKNKTEKVSTLQIASDGHHWALMPLEILHLEIRALGKVVTIVLRKIDGNEIIDRTSK
jgi:hypothetical protein